MEESKSSVILKRGLRILALGVLSIITTGVGAVVVFLTKENATTVEAITRLMPEILNVFQVASIPVALTAIYAALDKLRRWVNPEEPEPLTNEDQPTEEVATKVSARKRA